MRTDHYKRSVKCSLTDAELIAKGNELSLNQRETTRLEDESKAMSKSYKNRINGITERMNSLASEIEERKELRDEQVFDVLSGPDVVTYRVTTGEEVFRRKACPDDLQQALPLSEPVSTTADTIPPEPAPEAEKDAPGAFDFDHSPKSSMDQQDDIASMTIPETKKGKGRKKKSP